MGFKLLQISDCHLRSEADGRYRGRSPQAGLSQVLDWAADWKPDGVVVSGDLVEDAVAAAYRRLRAGLEGLGCPYAVLPGNHDDPALMTRIFGQRACVDVACEDWGDWRLLLLNSARPDRIDGRLLPDDLAALEGFLTEGTSPALVFLHHQPLPVATPWIDHHALCNGPELRGLLADHPSVRAVAWGHVHQAGEWLVDGIRWLAGPSSAINSVPGADDFTDDGVGPSARWFRLYPQGDFASGIINLGVALSE